MQFSDLGLDGALMSTVKHLGFTEPTQIDHLKYRGEGWPGRWRATRHDKSSELSYAESWGFLQAFRQWRCHICPDHSGEFSDISVGDPWYREIKPEDQGQSLIIVRSEKGREYLKKAVSAGYISIGTNTPEILPKSQPNLLISRGALWGRLLILRLTGSPMPSYQGFSFFIHWVRELSILQKIQSLVGTIKRVKRKSLRRSASIIDEIGKN